MNNLRWYEKTSELDKIMNFIQSIPKDCQTAVAQDFIQILMEAGSDEIEKGMNILSQNPEHSYTRWYDKNFDLSSALEIVKTFDEPKQKRIVGELKSSIYQMIVMADNA